MITLEKAALYKDVNKAGDSLRSCTFVIPSTKVVRKF